MLISGLLNSLNKSLSTNVVINSQKLISQSVLWQFCSGKTIHKNLYDILGINQEASIEQIKTKYYDLAKKYHPDTNSGQQEKFKQIYQAYQILGNNQKRKQYDQSIQGPYDRLRQQFGNDGYGPYDPEKMSNQTRKAYYNYSQPQWARIRRGVRPQSYTSYYSEQSMDRGPGDDAELEKFERKKATLKQMKQKQQQRRKEQTEKIRETIKKLDEENQKKHQQRLKKAQKQERRKILQSMERKWYGNFLQKMFAKLIHRGKYDDDDVKEKQPQKKDESKDQPSNNDNNQKKQK